MHCPLWGPVVKHSEPIGIGPFHSVHDLVDRSDRSAATGAVGGTTMGPHPLVYGQSSDRGTLRSGVVGGTTMGPHPSVSGQSSDTGTLRSCFSDSGGAPGHPHAFGCSRHSKVMHLPAYIPLLKHSLPIGMGPLGWMHVAREASDAVSGRGFAKTSARLQVSMLRTSTKFAQLVCHLTVGSQTDYEQRGD